MLITGILLIYLIGFSLLNTISLRFSFSEKLGLSFLLGLSVQTFGMLLLDGAGIPLTSRYVLIMSLLLILLLNVFLFYRRERLLNETREKYTLFPGSRNGIWLLFIFLIAYLEYMNWTKCMFFPTFDKDSLAGFDTLGWMISQEHTLKGLSVFDEEYMTGIKGPGSYITYIPMIQLSYAYVYLLGEETSKLIPALVYLSFLFSFYGVSRRFTTPTGAAMATFFMLITPEMLAFSSLSATNVIHAVYASLGVIYTVVWIREKNRSFFITAALLMASNVWIRNEGIVFIGAAILVIFFSQWKERNFKPLLLYIAISIFPLLVWNIFMKINSLLAENIFIFRPFWEKEKFQVILLYFKALLVNKQYYGIGFITFLVAILINLIYIIRKKDMLPLLSIIILSLFFYATVLYQIEYKWDSIHNVLAYSAKRFLFCFIPLIWLYILSNYWALWGLNKLEKVLSFSSAAVQK